MNLDYFVRDRLSKWIWHYKKTAGRANVVISYEDMREDIYAVMQRLFKALAIECDSGILKRSIEMSSFESIKKMGKESGTEGGGTTWKNKHIGDFTRSGETKQYRSILSEKTVEYTRRILRENEIDMVIE